MTWERRVTKPEHTCQPPSRGNWPFPDPVGAHGDLWRCDDCRLLWRVADACNICDHAGYHYPHGGQHMVGQRWRPATTGQRLTAWIADVRHRSARREPTP